MKTRSGRSLLQGAVGFLVTASLAAAAQAAEPVKIGFGMALTGPLSANGKSALLAMQIWEEDLNAKGGLLGRPVKLIYYDDQSSPAQVPAVYAKLLDVDKVDFIVSGYASGQIAPLMPVAIQRRKIVISLFGTGINDNFKYDRYFSMIPNGPSPRPAFTRGFFKVAMEQFPKPETIALAAADAEFGHNACEGARDNAKETGLKIVYDKSYPPATTDFSPVIRAVQSTKPDLFVICSYPLDSVGMIRAIHEVGFKPKMWGGAMIGPQSTAFKMQLGPLSNGLVNNDNWLPVRAMQFPGSMELLAKYQERAKGQGVDPLGYFIPVWAYSYLQLLQQAVEATKSFDEGQLADHMHKASFKLLVGDVRFTALGEWAEERPITVQFQNIKGNKLEEVRDIAISPILYPPQFKSGNVIYPYKNALK